MRALLVLEKSATRKVIHDYLSNRGFEVCCERTAAGALQQCEQDSFDLFVVDSVLPGGPIGNGLNLCRELRDHPRHERAVTVVLTVSDRPQDLRRLVDCGADDYVTLPLDPDLLTARLYLAEQRIQLVEELRRQGQGAGSVADLKHVADASPVMIWVTDDRGRATFFNRAYLEFTGRPLDLELGLGWADALHPEDYSRCLDNYLSSFEQSERFRDEYRVRYADGSYRWILATAVPRHNSDGNFAGFFGTGVDITDQKQSESLLRDSEERLRLVMRNMPVMMVAFDEAGRVIVWNRECERVTGYRATEIMDNPRAMEIFAPEEDDREVLLERWARPRKPYRDWELDVRCRDGVIRRVSWSNISDELQVTGWASWGIGVDVTERKRAEAEHRALEAKLQNAQRYESLSVLAGGVAHDFNNLLVGILGTADLARMELDPEHPACALLQKVEESAQMAAKLTSQMLAYSGRGQFILEPINLTELVDGVHNILETGVSKGIEFEYRLDPIVPLIEGDTTQIQQVALNLFVNAAEAMGERSGSIRVETGEVEVGPEFLVTNYLDEQCPEGRYGFLRVTDTGEGMAKETQARIFDPFFTTKFTGRGLGMAAVLGIVRGHNGAIKVESELGSGTAITVLFPVMQDAPGKSERTGESLSRSPFIREPALERDSVPSQVRRRPATGGGKRDGAILVVDDESLVRGVAQSMLERSGYQVLTAEDGPEALTTYRLRREEIQGVLLDLSMPRMDGAAVLRELQRIDDEIPVILTSGYSEEEVQGNLPGAVPAAFIQKPYTARTLVNKVRDVLRESKPSRNPEPSPGETPGSRSDEPVPESRG